MTSRYIWVCKRNRKWPLCSGPHKLSNSRKLPVASALGVRFSKVSKSFRTRKLKPWQKSQTLRLQNCSFHIFFISIYIFTKFSFMITSMPIRYFVFKPVFFAIFSCLNWYHLQLQNIFTFAWNCTGVFSDTKILNDLKKNWDNIIALLLLMITFFALFAW